MKFLIFDYFSRCLKDLYLEKFEIKNFLEDLIYYLIDYSLKGEEYKETDHVKITLQHGDVIVWEKTFVEDTFIYAEVFKTSQGLTVTCKLGNWLFNL